MAGVAAGFQFIVELAENLGGLDVDGVLFLEGVLLVAGDEGEVVNVLVKLGQREFRGLVTPAGKERQIAASPVPDRKARSAGNRTR